MRRCRCQVLPVVKKTLSPNKEYKPVAIREDFGKSSGRCCKTSWIKAGWLIKKNEKKVFEIRPSKRDTNDWVAQIIYLGERPLNISKKNIFQVLNGALVADRSRDFSVAVIGNLLHLF